jgi:hypothetical protein
MKKFIFILFAMLLTANIAKGQVDKSAAIQDSTHVYQLYPTENMWAFIKLDTSSGQIWQVHFAINDDSSRSEEILSMTRLAVGSEAKAGRFALYPTKNMFNFILLDKKDGRTWQVQWSFDYMNRGILPIN